MGFDKEKISAEVLDEVNLAYSSAEEKYTMREAMSKIATSVQGLLNRKLAVFERDIAAREKALELEKAACTAVVADYFKQVTELKAQAIELTDLLQEKSNGI